MQDTHRIRMGNLGVEVVVWFGLPLPQPTHLALMCMTYLPLPHALGSYLNSGGRKKLVLQPRSKPKKVCTWWAVIIVDHAWSSYYMDWLFFALPIPWCGGLLWVGGICNQTFISHADKILIVLLVLMVLLFIDRSVVVLVLLACWSGFSQDTTPSTAETTSKTSSIFGDGKPRDERVHQAGQYYYNRSSMLFNSSLAKHLSCCLFKYISDLRTYTTYPVTPYILVGWKPT